ncbi:bifunctional AP-4-A phosphorylase/ADP sulfurylase [Pestalotiopsis sp. IQ-011]
MTDMSPLRAPANLPSLVKTAFTNAKATGDLSYFPTQAALLKLNSVHLQLRFSPALASKPKGPEPSSSNKDDANKKKPFNPFENPLPSMTVVPRLPPSHALVLNKFAVVPEHSILITRGMKPQAHVLEADDLAAALACVRAYASAAHGHDKGAEAVSGGGDGVGGGSSELFVFFNSGPHSGASQPHRHLQLLPVEQMRAGLEDPSSWNVLAEGSDEQLRSLPFAVLREAIGPDTSAEDLHAKYVGLYRRAARLVSPGDGEDVPGEGEARFSYNMALTSRAIALCPRVAEGAPITDRDGREIGQVQLNGTLLAGTALVKNQELYDAIREDPELLSNVLKQIGVQPHENETVLGNL